MTTAQLVTTFLERCKAKKLSQNTITNYSSILYRFARDNQTLPTDPTIIENWLHTKGESFTHRGNTTKRLQAFYEDLRQTNTIQTNPIPPGQPGRPRNQPKTITRIKQLKADTTIKTFYPPQADTANLVKDYITSCRARGLSERTLKTYQTQLAWFTLLYPTITYNLSDIEKLWSGYGPEHDEWKHQLFTTVRTFYYWLADCKELPTLLRFRRITPKRSRKHPDNLSDEKAAELLTLLPTMPNQDRAIIELLIEAGPRISELCSIVKENIQMQYTKVFENGQEKTVPNPFITIKRKTGGKTAGKTGERVIEISTHVYNELRSLTPNNSGPIFWGHTNKPISGDAIYRLVSKYLAQIGITSGKRGPHMLRHTMGRLFIASEKGDLESLRQQMGHTNIGTTSIYTELNRKQVHKKFEAANPREQIMKLIHSNKPAASGNDSNKESVSITPQDQLQPTTA